MKRRIVTTAFGMLAIPLLGGAAYAAALSVSDNPKPQVVIPASGECSTVTNRSFMTSVMAGG